MLENPYAAPTAELENVGRREPSIFGSIQAAFGILSAPLLLALAPLGIPAILFGFWTSDLLEQERWGLFVFSMFLSLPVDALIAGVTFSAARHSFEGIPPSAVTLIREALEAWPRVVAASALSLVAMCAGLLFFLLPGFYFGVRLTFSGVAAFEQRLSAMDAMRASGRAANGRFWRVLLVSVLFLAPYLVFAVLGELAVQLSGKLDPQIWEVANTIVEQLSLSMLSAACWFYYRDIVDAQQLRRTD